MCRIKRMKMDTRDIRSATQVARNFGAIIDEIETGSTIVVVRNNRPVSVIAPVATMDRLDEIEEREVDIRLLAVALVRAATTQGPLVDLDDLIAELGVDPADLQEESDDE
jgi:prevent-host-death family protein